MILAGDGAEPKLRVLAWAREHCTVLCALHNRGLQQQDTQKFGWWRRGESKCWRTLKKRNLLILRNARNAKTAEVAHRGYAAVTRGSFATRDSQSNLLHPKIWLPDPKLPTFT